MISLFNTLISKMGLALTAVLNLLPTSPFAAVQGIDNQYLALINYIIPVNQIVAHLELYVTAVIFYYAIRVVLKWIKVAGS